MSQKEFAEWMEFSEKTHIKNRSRFEDFFIKNVLDFCKPVKRPQNIE